MARGGGLTWTDPDLLAAGSRGPLKTGRRRELRSIAVGADRAEQIPATTAVPAPQGRDRTTIVLADAEDGEQHPNTWGGFLTPRANGA